MKLIKIEKEYNNYYIVTYKKLWKEKTIKVFLWYGDVRSYNNGCCLSYSNTCAIKSAIQVMIVCNFKSLSLI